MDATGIVYADEDIRLSILRALEKKRIEEVKMVVNNYRVRFGYIVSMSSNIERTLRGMILRSIEGP